MTVAVGVVGCGWWSHVAHLPALRDDPRARLAAVADVDADRRASARAAFGAEQAFATWEELLDAVELDALIVATPPRHHFAPVAAALGRGIDVLVEKPMVVLPREGRELVALAAASGAELTVGYTFHHTPHAIALREAIAEGRIGTVEHVSCHFASIARELYRGRPEAYQDGATGFDMSIVPGAATYAEPAGGGGGQAHSQLTHSAALALHLTGLAPRRVSAAVASFELPVDLADVLAVELEGGAVAAFDSVGSIRQGHDEILQCRVYGDAGHVQLDAIRGTASIHLADGETVRLPDLPEDERYPTGAPARNLVGVTLGEEPNRAPGTLGLDVVALLDGALRAAAERRVVELADAA